MEVGTHLVVKNLSSVVVDVGPSQQVVVIRDRGEEGRCDEWVGVIVIFNVC